MIGTMTTAAAYDNSVRIGYARVSTRTQEHQAQIDALAAAHCREIIVETASTRGDRPKLREALGKLQAGDTLVIYKPDRVARSMKELLVLLEDQLHARGINLHILTGICAGIHRPDGATIADKMLFMVAAMAAEMERDLIRERTLDGLRAAEAQGRRGGRPAAVDDDVLAVARARQSRGESVTAIARHLKIGRSTLYRALQPPERDLARPPWSRPGKGPGDAAPCRPDGAGHAQRGRPGGSTSPVAGLAGPPRGRRPADPCGRPVRDPAPDVAAVAGPLPGRRTGWPGPDPARRPGPVPFPEPLRLLSRAWRCARPPLRRAGAPPGQRGRGAGRMARPVLLLGLRDHPRHRPGARTLAVEGTRRYAEVFELVYRRQAARPNEIWQADHTQLDLWVVTPAGNPARPWLTVIEDDHSRAIAGYAVNLGAPSALQTALVLRQAIWRKAEPGWHVCGIPGVFYTDHGSDFTSRHIEQAAADLGIRLVFSLPGQPRGRGKVERYMDTINQMCLAALPGYAPRGTKDRAGQAS